MVDLTSQEMLKFAIPALGISIAAPFMTCPGDVSLESSWIAILWAGGLDGLTQFQDMPMRVIPCVGSRQTCTEIDMGILIHLDKNQHRHDWNS